MNSVEKVLTEVVKTSGGDLILFFVVIAIVAVTISIPIARITTKSEKEKRELSFKREAMLIDVVKDNSSVISKLTTLIESNNKNCQECKTEQTEITNRILSKQEEILNIVSTASAVILDRKEK